MKIKRRLVAVLAAFAFVTLSGCATIIHGSTQVMAIQSNPAGATVAINGIRSAQTPASITLPRKQTHSLEISLDGFRPFQMQLQRGTSGWVWGNLVFGGLIGLVVDASSGAMYKLTPEQVSAQLLANGGEARLDQDRVYLFVTLEAETEWEVVAWLEAEE
jgi:hypothetical protein